ERDFLFDLPLLSVANEHSCRAPSEPTRDEGFYKLWSIVRKLLPVLFLPNEDRGPLPLPSAKKTFFDRKLFQKSLGLKLSDRRCEDPLQLSVVVVLREPDVLARKRAKFEFEARPMIEALAEKTIHPS